MRPSFLAALLFPLAVHAQSGQAPTDPYTETVKRVQERLIVNGYDVGRIDGILDVRTQGALAKFQQDNTLPAGGQMDRETLKALGVDWAELEVLRAAAESEGASAGQTGEPKPATPQ